MTVIFNPNTGSAATEASQVARSHVQPDIGTALDQAGGLLTGNGAIVPVELPVANTGGPAEGEYRFWNAGFDRPIAATLSGDGDVFLRDFAFFSPTDWSIHRVGDVFRLRQRNTGRFVQGHRDLVLTAPTATTNAGFWASDGPILADDQQLNLMNLTPTTGSGGTGLGAAKFGDHDCFVGAAIGTSASWQTEREGQGIRLKQMSSGRYLDAHESNGFRCVTRTRQANDSQVFDVEIIGGVYLVQHEGGNFLDAFELVSHSANVVPRQFNPTQKWAIVERADGRHTMQQISTGRYLNVDPAEISGFESQTATTVASADGLHQHFSLETL